MDKDPNLNEEAKESNKLPKNVTMLGFVSFFNDIASEMIYPLIPIFLTAVLNAPVAIVGLIEGIAEASSSLFKIIFGRLSDKYQKRKIFVDIGYSLTAISKVIIGLAYVWPVVLIGRFIDRMGKGIRTSPRDALIAESAPEEIRGKAFGFHRALDTSGAVIGPLFAILFLNVVKENLRTIFFIAFIPAVIGIILLLSVVKEKKKEPLPEKTYKFRWSDYNRGFKIFIIASLIFAIGNSSDAFLILRAKGLGLTITYTIFAYVLYNITYALFSMPAGIISDKIGSRKVLITGFVIFAAVYTAFGFINESIYVWLLFPIYGFYMALTDGVGKAYISKVVEGEKMGTAFGIYQTITGISSFAASLIAGLLWTYVSVSSAFIYGGITAIIAAIVFLTSRES